MPITFTGPPALHAPIRKQVTFAGDTPQTPRSAKPWDFSIIMGDTFTPQSSASHTTGPEVSNQPPTNLVASPPQMPEKGPELEAITALLRLNSPTSPPLQSPFTFAPQVASKTEDTPVPMQIDPPPAPAEKEPPSTSTKKQRPKPKHILQAPPKAKTSTAKPRTNASPFALPKSASKPARTAAPQTGNKESDEDSDVPLIQIRKRPTGISDSAITTGIQGTTKKRTVSSRDFTPSTPKSAEPKDLAALLFPSDNEDEEPIRPTKRQNTRQGLETKKNLAAQLFPSDESEDDFPTLSKPQQRRNTTHLIDSDSDNHDSPLASKPTQRANADLAALLFPDEEDSRPQKKGIPAASKPTQLTKLVDYSSSTGTDDDDEPPVKPGQRAQQSVSLATPSASKSTSTLAIRTEKSKDEDAKAPTPASATKRPVPLGKAVAVSKTQNTVLPADRMALKNAILNGDRKEVRKLLRKKPDLINQPLENGMHPLALAASANKASIVTRLLNFPGVEHNHRDKGGYTFAMWPDEVYPDAYMRTHEAILEYVQEHPNAVDLTLKDRTEPGKRGSTASELAYANTSNKKFSREQRTRLEEICEAYDEIAKEQRKLNRSQTL